MSDSRTKGSNFDSTRAAGSEDVADGAALSALFKEKPRIIQIGPHANDDHQQQHRPKDQNYIITAKYTLVTFLPKFLFEQFRRYANIFFLAIGLSQQIPDVSPTGRYVTIVPFTIILMLTAFKEIVEDFKRHKADRKVNAAETEVFDWRQKSFRNIKWKDICVGDVLRIKGETYFPADLILLSSSEPEGICTIETSNLDGETNLKLRSSLPSTKDYNDQDRPLADFSAELQCEQPNHKLYEFNGNLKIRGNDRPSPLNPSALLLRGAKLKNTNCIYGIAIYTGHETKLLMNSSKAPLKRSNIDKITNAQIIFLFLILLVMAFASATGSLIINNNDEQHDYIIQEETGSGFLNYLFNVLTFIILYNNLIPISLLVTLEMVKFIQAYFMNQDREMYHEETDTFAMARTSNLNEELGQIRYVFSDKTGTLTQNVMKFRECSIAGQKYNLDHLDQQVNEVDDTDPNAIFTATDSIINLGDNDEDTVKAFFVSMAVCHTVIPEVQDDGSIQYNASSPDEKALVEGAADFGYTFMGRKPTSDNATLVEVRFKNGQREEYEVLDTIEFTSDRKRMSTVVRFPDGKIRLLIKGADMMINDRLGPSLNTHKRHLDSTFQHLDDFASNGLRTLCLATKDISEDEYLAWKNEFIDASNAIVNREEKVEEVAAKLEKDLVLIGATAIEDKLQDGVPETIANLLKANIKVWILTGDKQETAINIGHSCRLLSKDVPLIILNSSSLDETRDEIAKEKAKLEQDSDKQEELSLIIDGKTLLHALEDSVRKEFIELCTACNAVICCRVSPIQKAEMVQLVQEHTKAISLAIGDGANDVAMIQKAQVGVGISGNEGLQAVNSADFAIAQFRFLQRLLFVHGAWNYTRISKVILYSFYKNICLYIIELWFAFYSYWTGQVLFERWTIGMYNIFFTGAPPIAIGLFDQNCKAETRINNPHLYKSSQKSDQFNNKIFWLWILLAVLHSLTLYFIPLGTFKYGIVWSSGLGGDYLVIGNVVYSCVILTVSIKALMILDSWNMWTSIAIFGSVAFWFVFLIVYSYFWPMGLGMAANMAGMIELIASTPFFWLSLLLVPLVSLIPDICGKVCITTIKPTESDLIKLAERSNYSPYIERTLDRLKKTLLSKSNRRSSEVQMSEREHQASRNSGRGFAFSQEEGGIVSQSELAQRYANRPKSRYEASHEDIQAAKTSRINDAKDGTIVNIQLAPCFDQPDHQFKRPIIYEVDDGTAVIKVVQFVKDIIEKQKAENLNDLNGVLSEKIQQKCVMRGPFEVGTTVEVKGVPHLFEGNVELKAYRVRQVDDASDEVERMFVVDALRKQLYSAANNDM